MIAGLDFGLPLTLMALMGWIVIALVPLMALTFVASVAWAGVRLFLFWRRAR